MVSTAAFHARVRGSVSEFLILCLEDSVISFILRRFTWPSSAYICAQRWYKARFISFPCLSYPTFYLNFNPPEVVSRYRDPQLQVGENYPHLFKAAPWDDINFRFYFCNEVVYPLDHDFIFFRVFRFKKIFLSTFLWIRLKPKLSIADLFCLHGNTTTWKYNYFTVFRCFKTAFWLFLYFQLWSVGYTASYKLNF